MRLQDVCNVEITGEKMEVDFCQVGHHICRALVIVSSSVFYRAIVHVAAIAVLAVTLNLCLKSCGMY